MYESLRYTDEYDKSLGIAGMTVAIYACDGERCIAEVSLEEGEESLVFTPETFYAGNPRFSAKIAWNQLMHEFHLISGMVLGNVMCRCMLADKPVSRDILDDIRDFIFEQGHDRCELDDDEIDEIFNKDAQYFRRLFSHPTVADVTTNLAGTLRLQRRMTAGDLFDQLSRLSSF